MADYSWMQVAGSVSTDDAEVAESLLRFKMDKLEAALKGDFAHRLYGGPSERIPTEAQLARAPGYYWTRYQAEAWTLDHWDGRLWSFTGSDEPTDSDPPQIVGPVEPPPN